MKSEKEIVSELQKSSGSSLKILTTEEHRKLKSMGRSVSGYNIIFSGIASYNFERQTKGLMIGEDRNDPFSAVHEGQPIRGVYKILDIDGENDSRNENNGHGFHHSNQTFRCLYNRFTDADFMEDEIIEILSYPLWQSVAIRNTNRLQIGDVFIIDSFELIDKDIDDAPYTCYQTKWRLISRDKDFITYPISHATEGVILPEESGEVKLYRKRTLSYYLEQLRQQINKECDFDYMLIKKSVMDNIAQEKPTSFLELKQIKGVGPYILHHFGGLILSVIINYGKNENSQSQKSSSSFSQNNFSDSSITEELKKYRTQQASKKQIPPYCIFSDKIIEQISEKRPTTRKELLAINGIGEQKYIDYGADIINIVEHCSQSVKKTKSGPSHSASQQSKSCHTTGNSRRKGDSAIESTEMYYNGYYPEEIAERRGIQLQTVYYHLFQTNAIKAEEYITPSNYKKAKEIYDANYEDRSDRIHEFLDEAGIAAFFHLRRQGSDAR